MEVDGGGVFLGISTGLLTAASIGLAIAFPPTSVAVGVAVVGEIIASGAGTVLAFKS